MVININWFKFNKNFYKYRINNCLDYNYLKLTPNIQQVLETI